MTKLNQYVLRFSGNGNTSGNVPITQSAETEDSTYTFTIPGNDNLLKPDYAFMGWAESPSAVYPEYRPNSSITLTQVSSNKVLYAVWVNGNSISPVTTWNNLYYMQQMSPTACASIPTPTSTTEATEKQLYDVRDGKQYWVAKLKDGNCWMTQNLDLDLKQGVILTDADSDFTESIVKSWTPGKNEGTITEALSTVNWPDTNNIIRSWDPALGEKPTHCNDGTTAGNCKASDGPTNSVNDNHDAQGNYYSWGAATAGEASSLTSDTSGQESTRSICPKGWRLPLSGSSNGVSSSAASGSFWLMINKQLNITTTSTADTNMLKKPLYFVRGGIVRSGKLGSAGSHGYYWSSTANSGTNAYLLYFYSSSVNPSDNFYRYLGMSVRCVAR